MKTPAMKENKKGFTLLELLVVISIIGILAALLLANFNATRERARDAARQSDIKQYQTSLGQYASENTGLYPVETSIIRICDENDFWSTDLGLPICIDDPQAPVVTQRYWYLSNDTGTEYAVWAQLENGTDLWVLCSNGLVGETDTAPDPSGEICPLVLP